jgi:hypothetical protein
VKFNDAMVHAFSPFWTDFLSWEYAHFTSCFIILEELRILLFQNAPYPSHAPMMKKD